MGQLVRLQNAVWGEEYFGKTGSKDIMQFDTQVGQNKKRKKGKEYDIQYL